MHIAGIDDPKYDNTQGWQCVLRFKSYNLFYIKAFWFIFEREHYWMFVIWGSLTKEN